MLSTTSGKLRSVSICPENQKDYTDLGYRRIFGKDGKIELRDAIFSESVLLCSNTAEFSITLHNCEFKKGFGLRSDNVCERIKFMIFESDIRGKANITSNKEGSLIIDSTNVDEVFVYGRFAMIDFFKSSIGLFQTEGLVCDFFRAEKADIRNYGLYKFRCDRVEFETDDLAINDWSRFKSIDNLSVRRCAEEYHLFVLKSSRTIASNVAIRYQLAKATSHWSAMFFGYFYRPLTVIGWMTAVVLVFGFAYHFVLQKSLTEAIFFSVYTFFTIGYGALSAASFLQTILVYLEALFGVVYSAALLITLMNITRKVI